jgi:hypothetical protein
MGVSMLDVYTLAQLTLVYLGPLELLLLLYLYLVAPLKAVPGRWLSRLTPLFLPGLPLNGKRLLQMHQKYGKSRRKVTVDAQAPSFASARTTSLSKAPKPSNRSTRLPQNGLQKCPCRSPKAAFDKPLHRVFRGRRSRRRRGRF